MAGRRAICFLFASCVPAFSVAEGHQSPTLPEDGQQAPAQEIADAQPVAVLSIRMRLQTDSASLGASRLYQRATARVGAWELAAVAERDPGERRWLDHAVAYGHWRPADRPLELAVGDLRPGFGQGLLFGRGISVGVPTPRVRRDSGAVGYRSASENRDLRGGFLRWRRRRTEVALVLGRFARDARLDSAGVAVSLPEDGNHAGNGEGVRNRLRGTAIGVRGAVNDARGRMGFTLQHLSFDRALDLRRPGRVSKGFAGRGQLGLAADFVLELPAARLYLAAARAGPRPAAVAGIVGVRVSGVRVDVIARAYGSGYFSPFGAAASGNGMNDERGLTVRFRRRGWQVWLDETRRMSPRWTEPVPGAAVGLGLKWQRRLLRRLQLSVDAQRRRRSQWTSGAQTAPASDRMRSRARWSAGPLRAEATVDGTRAHQGQHGYAVALSGQHRTGRREWSVHATRYRTDGYATRIYEYERDLPGTVSIRPLYGEGWRVYAMVGVQVGVARLWCRGRYEARRGESPRRQLSLQVDMGSR